MLVFFQSRREALWKIFHSEDFANRLAQRLEIEENLPVERDKPCLKKKITSAQLHTFFKKSFFSTQPQCCLTFS